MIQCKVCGKYLKARGTHARLHPHNNKAEIWYGPQDRPARGCCNERIVRSYTDTLQSMYLEGSAARLREFDNACREAGIHLTVFSLYSHRFRGLIAEIPPIEKLLRGV